MKITKRQLKRIIREEHTRLRRQGLIKESAGKYAEIAKMLVSNNEVSINQAIELGQTVGILELEDTFRREVDNSGFGRRRKNRYEKDLIEIQKDIKNKITIKKVEFAREVLEMALDGKVTKINKKLDWRHLVSESMKQKNQQNQEKTFVN